MSFRKNDPAAKINSKSTGIPKKLLNEYAITV